MSRTISRMGTRVLWHSVAIALTVLGTVLSASAQQSSALTMSFENVTAARDSARTKAGRTAAAPDDTLRYQIGFTNTQTHALERVVFDNPLPRGLVLVSGTVVSSAPARIEYSADGGKTFSARPMVQVEEAGKRVERPASPASYTHIRWIVTGSVAPGARVTARFDAHVSTHSAPIPGSHQK
ncbi:MAG TPA: hypothetical protein VMN60_07285 [Longimicrobiales bacterium]|nr:hypothetical protein [Longimicrobiales bacterium]